MALYLLRPLIPAYKFARPLTFLLGFAIQIKQ
jgi:hypothetical protein